MVVNITAGISNELSTTVKLHDTAKNHGSGLLEVYSTPAMISLMEKTSMELIQQYLPEGKGTVGTRIEVDHLRPTSVGSVVKCRSVLIGLDNRHLKFEVSVTENDTLIGNGVHERFIIDEKLFLEKLTRR